MDFLASVLWYAGLALMAVGGLGLILRTYRRRQEKLSASPSPNAKVALRRLRSANPAPSDPPP